MYDINEIKNTILCGDALHQLKEIPTGYINCCMTSPPYWALRDYGTASWEGGDENCDHLPSNVITTAKVGNTQKGIGRQPYKDVCGKCGAKRVDKQLGLEPTFDEYIKKLCDIFDEVKRVLRDDGTCWVNLGDTYGGTGAGQEKSVNSQGKFTDGQYFEQVKSRELKARTTKHLSKSLIMIPFRFVIEMVNRGWILRNTIIWHKPNCMPSSVKDRFTVDFEYLFFFSKKKSYYFETQLESAINVPGGKSIKIHDTQAQGKHGKTSIFYKSNKHSELRNKRTVWSICPKPFSEAHFAVYPEELCETPIKAGCPEFVCVKCGNPKKLQIEYSGGTIGKSWHDHSKDKEMGMHQSLGGLDSQGEKPYKREIKGYKPTCNCNAGFTGGIVLDPFFGAGTTGLVALKQNKNFLGIELNPEYIEIANKRLKPFLEQTTLNLNKPSRSGK